MLLNGFLVLVAPNFRNRSKKCQKKNWMFFGRVFARLRGIKMAHCQFTKVHQWNDWNPSRRAAIDRFLRSLPLNKPFLTISDPAFTEANKALEHLQKPQKNRQHCRPNRAHKKRSETNFQWTYEETVRQRWARTGREQNCRKTTEDDLVLPQSLFWPTRTRDSTPANTKNSVVAKIQWRSWVFWWAEPKRQLA